MSDSLYIKNFVDKLFCVGGSPDSDNASIQLISELRDKFDNDRFEKMIMTAGWIPDLYVNDSSEETLYSKMIEVLVSEWARRIGGTGECVKVKSDYEDVKITIANSIIVCDAKSFRLSRSQKAPNPKDVVKPEAFSIWAKRHQTTIGGLITFPSTHEWKRKSVVYRDCSRMNNPILLLSYKHLALLLHYKGKYQVQDLLQLWDYKKLFPKVLSGKDNRAKYWEVINQAIRSILSISEDEFSKYMEKCDGEIEKAIKEYRNLILDEKKRITAMIRSEVAAETDIDILRKKLIKLRITTETKELSVSVDRINKFRLS